MTQKISEETNKRFLIGKLLDCTFLLFMLGNGREKSRFNRGVLIFCVSYLYLIPREDKLLTGLSNSLLIYFYRNITLL